MGKLYFAYFFILSFLFAQQVFAQAPVIKYPSPKSFTVGVKISTVAPASTGGTVPNEVYSKVVTIAGNGFYGYKDTTALQAMFASPQNTAIDKNGNIYIAESNFNTIRKITAAGVVSTFAGNSKAKAGAKNGRDTAARFNYPTGVAVDKAGNVYVADRGNNMIRKITPDGVVTTLAGFINGGSDDGQGTAARFNLPFGIAVDKNDNIFVADTYNQKIRKITPGGLVSTVAGSGQTGKDNGSRFAASFNVPANLAVDDDGNIFVADQNNKCIRKIATNGTVSFFTDTIYTEPVGVAVDKLKRVYLTTAKTYTILQFNANGQQIGNTPFSGNIYKNNVDGIDTLSSYKGSMGLTFDGKDNLLVADLLNGTIRKLAVSGYQAKPLLPDGLAINGKGEIIGTPLKTTPSATYTITAYNNSGSGSAKITLGVVKGTQAITFNTPPALTYGDKDSTLLATSTDTLIKINFASSNPSVATIVNGKVHIVSAGTTIITATQDGNVNYAPATPVKRTLVINKATLTVTAGDITRTYKDNNPTLWISYKGYVKNQDSTILITKAVATTTATKASAVGVYPITVSGASAKNYQFKYVAGKLTVFPVPVITAVGSTSIIKGDSVILKASPASGYAFQWTFNGDPICGATKATYAAKQTGGYNVNITANGYTTYSLYTSVLAQLYLPADNFKLKLTSVSCKGSNNGSILISANKKLKYIATVTGNSLNKPFNFTSSLTIPNLSPGNYSICIGVDGEIFSQCFKVIVTEPKDLSVYSTVNKTLNNINLQLDGGSTFNITLNDVNYTTTQKEITLPLLVGTNKIRITTDNLCQGVVEKTITLNDKVKPFPNPFTNILYVNIGNAKTNKVQVKIVSVLDGKQTYSNSYTNKSGILELDLSALANGVYYLSLNLDDKQSGYKIIKK
ncbi:T9SS type A sorting domain-containing protein [Inquilinus sp. KBS0705]|nr:T9SS type A sorting domain-containing protein [Inquilinus sp. KBS0705]